eukprot:COSAG01_NODE_1668_length_9563_cov_23.675613_7_plen_190_part_00
MASVNTEATVEHWLADESRHFALGAPLPDIGIRPGNHPPPITTRPRGRCGERAPVLIMPSPAQQTPRPPPRSIREGILPRQEPREAVADAERAHRPRVPHNVRRRRARGGGGGGRGEDPLAEQEGPDALPLLHAGAAAPLYRCAPPPLPPLVCGPSPPRGLTGSFFWTFLSVERRVFVSSTGPPCLVCE